MCNISNLNHYGNILGCQYCCNMINLLPNPHNAQPIACARRWDMGCIFMSSGLIYAQHNPDSKVYGANMGPNWVLLAPDGPHVGPMNLAIREVTALLHSIFYVQPYYNGIWLYDISWIVKHLSWFLKASWHFSEGEVWAQFGAGCHGNVCHSSHRIENQ